MKSIAIFLGTFITCFLLAAFVAWDFNPATWGSDGRFFAFMCSITAASIATVFSETKV